jgi:hypothetical protein
MLASPSRGLSSDRRTHVVVGNIRGSTKEEEDGDVDLRHDVVGTSLIEVSGVEDPISLDAAVRN